MLFGLTMHRRGCPSSFPHVRPAQQIWSKPPQVQRPFAQVDPSTHAVPDVQHTSPSVPLGLPAWPHVEQTPPTHAFPLLHDDPQHGSPVLPQ